MINKRGQSPLLRCEWQKGEKEYYFDYLLNADKYNPSVAFLRHKMQRKIGSDSN